MTEPGIEKKPQDRLQALDAVRGIAALSVVFYHYTSRFPEMITGAAASPIRFDYGYYGVHLFFMVSGFVILMSLERRQGKGFVKSRFIRLYPLYWACVLLTFAVLTLFPLQGYEVTAPQLAVNMTMLTDYVRLAAPIDGVYWSLTYELGFYAFMFAIFKFRLTRFVGWLPILWAAGSLAFLFLERLIPHPLHLLLVINQYGYLFGAGLCFYLARTRGWTPLLTGVVIAAPFIELAHSGITGFIAIALSAALMALATDKRFSSFNVPRALIFLGTISYALYLTHQMIGYRILLWLQEAGAPPLVAFAITTLTAIALAAALTYGIEKPAAQYLKKKL